MGSLTSALGVATQSLLAQEAAIAVTNNNISNANTQGYSREIINFSENAPTEDGSASVGAGVDVQSITSVQDQLLSLAIQQQTSQQSGANAQVNTLNEIQTLFPSSGSSLSSAFSTFFTSLSALSSDPTSRSSTLSLLD
jgi:flagellar hook-associated protein 1 FlgK